MAADLGKSSAERRRAQSVARVQEAPRHFPGSGALQERHRSDASAGRSGGGGGLLGALQTGESLRGIGGVEHGHGCVELGDRTDEQYDKEKRWQKEERVRNAVHKYEF